MKIVSWNSQGNKDFYYGTLLATYHPDVLCLQECGNIQYGTDNEDVQVTQAETLRFRKAFGRTECLVNYWPADARNGRCSMAMLIPDASSTGQCAAIKSWSLRPALAIKRGSLWIVNVHAVASAAAAANDQDFIDSLCERGYNGLCVGDFNCTPAELTARGLNSHAQIVCPGQATHFGAATDKELDYGCLINTRKQATCQCHNDTHGSDHTPVIFTLT